MITHTLKLSNGGVTHQLKLRSCLLASRFLNKQANIKAIEPVAASSPPSSPVLTSTPATSAYYPSSQSIHEKLNDFYNDPNKTKSQKIKFIRQWVQTLLEQGRFELVGSIVNRFDHKIPKPVTPLNFIFKTEGEYWNLLNELSSRRQHLASGLLLVKMIDLNLQFPNHNVVDRVAQNLLFVEGLIGMNLALNLIASLISSNRLSLLSHDFYERVFKDLAKLNSDSSSLNQQPDKKTSLKRCFSALESYIHNNRDAHDTLKLLVAISYQSKLENVALDHLKKYFTHIKSEAGSVNGVAASPLNTAQQRRLVNRISVLYRSFSNGSNDIFSLLPSDESVISETERNIEEKHRLFKFNSDILDNLLEMKQFYVNNTSKEQRDINTMLNFMDILSKQLFTFRTDGLALHYSESNNASVAKTDLEFKEVHNIISKQTPKTQSEIALLSSFSDYFAAKFNINFKGTNTSKAEKVDDQSSLILNRVYRNLVSFLCDKEAHEIHVGPSSSYERHLYRIVSEELGLRHFLIQIPPKDQKQRDKYLNPNSNKSTTIRFNSSEQTDGMLKFVKPFFPVYKNYKNNINYYDYTALKYPKTLNAIMLNDSFFNGENTRKFDGHLPLHQELQETLEHSLRVSRESPSSLSSTSVDSVNTAQQAVLRALSPPNGVYSSQWALLWTDFLIKNQIAFPSGLLSRILDHSIRRSDMYGVLETLYLSVYEARRSKIIPDFIVNNASGDKSVNVDSLNVDEWGKAIELIVNKLKFLDVSDYNHDAIIGKEFVHLFNEYGAKDGTKSLRARLHYASIFNPRSNRTVALLHDINVFKKVDGSIIDARVVEDMARVLLNYFNSSNNEGGEKDKESDFIFKQNFDQGIGRPFNKLNSNMKHPSYIDELINVAFTLEVTWLKNEQKASSLKVGSKKNFLSNNAYFSKVLQFHRVHANSLAGKMRMHVFILRNIQRNNRILNSIKYGPLASQYEELFCKLLIYSCFQIMDSFGQINIRRLPHCDGGDERKLIKNSDDESSEASKEGSTATLPTSSYELVRDNNLSMVFNSMYKFLKVYLLK